MPDDSLAIDLEPPAAGREYAELRRKARDAGLLDAQPAYYWRKSLVTIVLFAVPIALALVASSVWVIVLAAVLLGFASTQGAMLAHDVGHRQGFRGRRTNAIARYFMGNVLLGISQSWWIVKHNQHHAAPNHTDADPDIQFPMIVFSHEQIDDRARWLRPLIAVQAFVFPVLLPFQAVNMRISSVTHLFSPGARRPFLQGALIALHFVLYAWLLYAIGDWTWALIFLAVHQSVFGLYNSSVFATNHKGMPLTDSETTWDFVREQVLTSRNVHPHPVTDFFCGGLNYQIEHHLFPAMPRNNLKAARLLVRDFCAREGIPYYSTSLLVSYGEVFAHLHRVSAPLRSGLR